MRRWVMLCRFIDTDPREDPDMAMTAAKRTESKSAPAGTKMTLAHANLSKAPATPGRRSFMTYRDLGVAAASHGRLRAQTMATKTGMTKPTGWHYHTCEGQFIYALKGWVDLEFETGETIRVKAGESLFIPGGLKHNETATSDDLEILELSVPAEMGTVPCEKPA
jgi:quercetin dioxygenase-like cupin family protein